MKLIAPVYASDIYSDLASRVGLVDGNYFTKVRLYDVVDLVRFVAIGIGFIGISLALVHLITSAGDPGKAKKAYTAFLFGIIAVVVGLLLGTFGNIILKTIGVNTAQDAVTNTPAGGGGVTHEEMR